MRVVYVSPVYLASKTGDTEHVISVCRQMALQGVEVHLVAVGTAESAREAAAASGLHVHAVRPGVGAVGLVRRVSSRARELVDTLEPDVVYLRPFPLAWMFLLHHVRSRHIPYVYELNTFTASERKSKGQPIKGRLYEWSEVFAIRNASGLVTVTEELALWAYRIAGVRIPTLVAGNGVDPDGVHIPQAAVRAAVRERVGTPQGALVLAMAGFAGVWQGFDRAIAMLGSLDRDTELWLIGADSREVEERALSLARELAVDRRLKVFPRLGAVELGEVLSAADIGIGPLAFDRQGMREAQPIKVRLYLASGLPVLYNHVDPKLDGTLPFLSYVPSTDARDLAAGVAKIRGIGRGQAGAIRAFAAQNLSWQNVAAETRRFLTGLLPSTDL